MQEMSGVLRKKGRHSMQGYKERGFIIKDNVLKYGPPGAESKWSKKIKLADLLSIDPQVSTGELKHCFTLTKKDGRVLYFAASSDEEKWKWIGGFREAVKIAESPLWSPADEVSVLYDREPLFVPLLKLGKFTRTNNWRWRYFLVDDTQVVYYGDPGLGAELGAFPLQAIKKVEWKKDKHGKENAVMMEIKKPSGNREYWFSHPDEGELKKFYDKVKLDEKPRKKSLLMLWS